MGKIHILQNGVAFAELGIVFSLPFTIYSVVVHFENYQFELLIPRSSSFDVIEIK